MAPTVARRCCAGWYPGAVICLAAWYRKLRFRAVLIQAASRLSPVSLREKVGSWGVSDHANCWNLRCAFVVDGPRYARRTECYVMILQQRKPSGTEETTRTMNNLLHHQPGYLLYYTTINWGIYTPEWASLLHPKAIYTLPSGPQ